MSLTPPSKSNGYLVSNLHILNAALWNASIGDLAARVDSREALEASFQTLLDDGYSATLTMIQTNLADKLDSLQETISNAEEAIEGINTVTAPNSLKLGGKSLSEVQDGAIKVGGATLASIRDASQLTGYINRDRLSAGLGTTAEATVDWNTAASNGWFKSDDASNNPNSVSGLSGWFIAEIIVHHSSWIIQTGCYFTVTGSLNTQQFRREKKNGSWGAWYKLQSSQAEQDARYARLSESNVFGGTVEGSATNSDGIRGISHNTSGVFGQSQNGNAGFFTANGNGSGVFAQSAFGWAGYFTGGLGVHVQNVVNCGYLAIRPQDGGNEGGELALIGAGANNPVYLDNFNGFARILGADIGIYNFTGSGIYYQGKKIGDDGWKELGTWDHSADVNHVDFTGLGEYREIQILMEDLVIANGFIGLRLSGDNGASYVASGYKAAGADYDGSHSVSTEFPLHRWSNSTLSGLITLQSLNKSTRTHATGTIFREHSVVGSVSGTLPGTHNALRIFSEANAHTGRVFTAGNIIILGRK